MQSSETQVFKSNAGSLTYMECLVELSTSHIKFPSGRSGDDLPCIVILQKAHTYCRPSESTMAGL